MRTLLCSILFTTLFLASTTFAQPNDLCANAQLLAPGLPVSSTTTGATASAPGSCNNATLSPDVWYRLDISTSAWYSIELSTSTNINLRLFSICPGASTPSIFCTDRPPTSSYINTLLLTPASYYLRVSGVFGGSGPFTISYSPYAALSYDSCPNATLISPSTTDPLGNNYNCTDSTLPDPTCSPQRTFFSDVWWRWNAASAGTLLIGTLSGQPAANLAVYDGGPTASPLCPADQSTFITCSNASNIASLSTLPGHAYFIRQGSPTSGPAAQGTTGFHLTFAISTSGACCAPAGTCTLVSSAACTAGTYSGNGTVCSPNPCTPIGACCGTLNSCSLRSRIDCQILAQVYLGDGTTCVATPCSQIGTCCRGTICNTNVSRLDCAGISTGGQFVLTSSCTTPQQTPTCCAPDYNHTGGTNVQDIFDFLASWFASNPWTNINGGPLDVSDIFSFLSAWFTGC